MERTYSFDVDDVWHAWTDPERVARWLGTASGELAEGGVVHLRMSPPDADPADIATLVVLRCDAQRRLTVRWSWPGEPDSIVDLTLAPEGAGTRLVLEHLPLTDGLATEYGAGWEDFLAKLATTLAGGEHHGNDDVARTRLDLAQVGVCGPPNGHAAGWYAYELALAGHLGGMAHSEAEWQVDWELAMAILRD